MRTLTPEDFLKILKTVAAEVIFPTVVEGLNETGLDYRLRDSPEIDSLSELDFILGVEEGLCEHLKLMEADFAITEIVLRELGGKNLDALYRHVLESTQGALPSPS